MPLSPETLAAIRRHGSSVDNIGKRYGISGAALLAKLVQGESGDRGDAVSPAGARGWSQFMPGSRKIAMDKFGVDPWADVDQAVRGAALHLQGKINGSTGLEGYNPGSPTYTGYILGQRVGNVAAGARPQASPRPNSRSPAAAGPSSAAPSFAAPSLAQGQAGDFAGLLGSLLQKPEPVQPQVAVAAPSFAASPVMPQAFQPAMPQAVQASDPQSGVSQALGLLESLRGSAPTVTAGQAPETADGVSESPLPIVEEVAQTRQQRADAKALTRGKVTVAPGANRQGVGLSKNITRFVERVAGIYGKPLTITTGTNHSQYTVNGNVSNHWDGNGADLPASGAALLRQGRAALVAAGMDPKQARAAKGGLYNVGGYQIIFATNEGGNHHDHLHVGYRGR